MTASEIVKKRTVISLETKYEKIIKHQDGVTVTRLSKDFNLAASTICTIIAEKEKYLKAIEDNALRDRKRLKMSSFPKIGNVVPLHAFLI